MDEKAIKNIHDKYFKQTFGDIETTIAFLEEYLPKEITKDIDYRSLNLINPSSIGKDFKLSESDLLFKVKIGKTGGSKKQLFAVGYLSSNDTKSV